MDVEEGIRFLITDIGQLITQSNGGSQKNAFVLVSWASVPRKQGACSGLQALLQEKNPTLWKLISKKKEKKGRKVKFK